MKRQLLKPHFRRKLLLIAVICLLLAAALELYTFGIGMHFISRLLRSFFVVYVIISLTALAIVPGVSNSVDRLMRK